MKTIILGKKSNLTNKIKIYFKDTICLSFQDINNNIFKEPNQKYNLIINSSFSASKINKISNYEVFFQRTIHQIIKFLATVDLYKINKIIFTSSASVYGLTKPNYDNKSIYSLSKLIVENFLLSHHILKNKTIIARVFNIFDENDKFSLISKIIEAKKKNKSINILNSGDGVRDYIYSSDVAKIYKVLIKSNLHGIVDIGSGYGYKTIDLVSATKCKYLLSKKKSYEQSISIANLNKINHLIKNIKFNNLTNFLKKQKIFLKRKIKKINIQNNNDPNLYNLVTVIYGAGYSGKKLCNEIIKNNNKNFIYFIDDDLRKKGKTYKSFPILSFENFIKIFKYFNISNFIIAIPSLNFDQKQKILTKCQKIHKNILTLPDKNLIIDKKIKISDLSEIKFNDFFTRNLSEVKYNLISYLNYSNVLITGGAGSIGSELVNQILSTKVNKIIIYDNNETELFRIKNKLSNKKIITILGDINDNKFLKQVIFNKKIKYIFHAAAYKHVGILENNFYQAFKNNVIGTLNVLKSLNKNVKGFIFISTDKAANPKNNLGYTKKIAEEICKYYFNNYFKNIRLTIVRFGNVFGSRGSAIEVFVKRIKQNLPIIIRNKSVERYFMSIKEACNLVMQSHTLPNKSNGIFILRMGKPIKIINLVKKILLFYGKENYPIKYRPLEKGEKLTEILSTSKIKIKTTHSDIFIVNEKKISFQGINKFFELINKNFVDLKLSRIKKILDI